MNALLDQAKQNDADDTVGGGDFEVFLHPEGPTLARFVGYVEVGMRPQKPWKGQAKKPAPEARFTFELNGPKSMREITPEGEEPYTVPTLIRIKLAKKGGDKSSYVKLMRKMAYGRDITNFATMLGEGYLITIHHGEGKDRDGNDKTYHNMRDAEGTFTIAAPMMTDPLSGATTMFDIPELVTDMAYLSWDNPTVEQWASIFIDGERTVKDKEGNETTESKNWLQRDIVTNAMNFGGSPLEALLNGMADLTMPTEDPSGGLAQQEREDRNEDAESVAVAAQAAALATLEAEAAANIAKAVNPPVDVPKTAAAAVGLEKPNPDTQKDEAAAALAAAKAVFDSLNV